MEKIISEISCQAVAEQGNLSGIVKHKATIEPSPEALHHETIFEFF